MDNSFGKTTINGLKLFRILKRTLFLMDYIQTHSQDTLEAKTLLEESNKNTFGQTCLQTLSNSYNLVIFVKEDMEKEFNYQYTQYPLDNLLKKLELTLLDLYQ